MSGHRAGGISLNRCYPYGSQVKRPGRPGWRLAFPDREWHEDEEEWWVADAYEPAQHRLFPDFGLYADAPRLF